MHLTARVWMTCTQPDHFARACPAKTVAGSQNNLNTLLVDSDRIISQTLQK